MPRFDQCELENAINTNNKLKVMELLQNGVFIDIKDKDAINILLMSECYDEDIENTIVNLIAMTKEDLCALLPPIAANKKFVLINKIIEKIIVEKRSEILDDICKILIEFKNEDINLSGLINLYDIDIQQPSDEVIDAAIDSKNENIVKLIIEKSAVLECEQVKKLIKNYKNIDIALFINAFDTNEKNKLIKIALDVKNENAINALVPASFTNRYLDNKANSNKSR
jgi:hypothetical protein